MAQIKKAIVVVLTMAILFSLSVALSACGNDSELKWRFELNEDGKSYTATLDQKYSFDEEAYRKYAEKHPDDEQALEKKYAELLEKAYKNCNKVTEANVPAEYKGLPVTKVNTNFLYAFPNLKTITVSEKSEHFRGYNNVLYSKKGDIIYFSADRKPGTDIAAIILYDNIKTIGDSAFSNYTVLPSIEIPYSVTSIGSYAFYGCINLTSIKYDGTTEQWQAIQFGENWNEGTGEYVVHCTDGTVAKTAR